MPDAPVDRADPPAYDPGHETRISRLEEDVRDVKATLAQMVPTIVRIDSMLTATLPHLATKAELAELRAGFKSDTSAIMATLAHLATTAELAEKPGKAYLWGVLAALIATYASGLAGLAVLLH
jgi:hypothetical protein